MLTKFCLQKQNFKLACRVIFFLSFELVYVFKSFLCFEG